MNIVTINASNYGSTGRIMLAIAERARSAGHTVYTVCPDSRDNRRKDVDGQVLIGSRISRNLHRCAARLTGLHGCFSYMATRRLIRLMKRTSTELVHLHNLHSWYLHLPTLFRFIKKHGIRVVWTLHDCWAFTGHCPYYDIAACDKWQTACASCPQYRLYPQSFVDNSRMMYHKKKRWFTGVKDMTLVTPSRWLADQVAESFLKTYPVRVIHNGIDRSVFRPTPSDLRERYGLENKRVLLGVAFDWGERKGLDVCIELSRRLPDDYRIVLVGTSDAVDRQLPDNILSIHRTHDRAELAAWYTTADLFINPTREDNFPTVNLESLACGTPGITFRTGGSPECFDGSCGVVVEKTDIDAMEREILRVCEERPFTAEACVAFAKRFDQNDKFIEYVDLYEDKA